MASGKAAGCLSIGPVARKMYLFTVDRPTGFALVRLDLIEMAEFFVLRKYRNGGTGTAVAHKVIARHP